MILTRDYAVVVKAEHNRLLARFSDLAEARNGAPVYALEHGLAPGEVASLSGAVGAGVRAHGTESWWVDRWLPLLVVAAETGYRYRGTGTDFWPALSEELGANLSLGDHARLTEFYAHAHRTLRFKKPADNAWNRLFHHIAWPIANAVAPVEIHRALAQALHRLFLSPPRSFEGEDLAAALQMAARFERSGRLSQWLSDDALAVALARRLLRLEDVENLSSEVVDRIWSDLSADPVARSALRQATRKHRLLERDRRPPQIDRSRLQLAIEVDGRLSLLLTPPRLAHDVAQPARRRLRGVRAVPWDGCASVDVDALFRGHPIALSAQRPPTPSDVFFPDLDELIGNELSNLVRSMGPAIAAPLLFAADCLPADLSQSDSPLPAGGRAWILAEDAPDVPAIRSAGPVAGKDCFEVDLTDASGRQWLESFSGRGTRPALSVVGANVIGSGPRGPNLDCNQPTLLKLAGHGFGDVVLSVGGETVTLSDDVPFVLVEAGPGDYFAELETTTGPQTRGAFAWSLLDGSDRSVEPPVEFILEPADATVDDLVRGEVAIQVRSSHGFVLPVLTISLVHGDEEIGRQQQVKVRAPSVIGQNSVVMRALTQEMGQAGLSYGAVVYLIADSGGGLRQWWRLEREPRAVTWEQFDEGWRAWLGEDQLEVRTVSGERPLDVGAKFNPVENLALHLPISGDDYLDEYGLVTGGRRLVFPQPVLPDRAARDWSLGGEEGPSHLMRAWLRWSAAEASGVVFEGARRVVADRLQSRTVEVLCGTPWLEAEEVMRSLPAGRWAILGYVAVERGLHKAGFDYHLDPSDRETMVRQLGARIRLLTPDIWSIPADAIEALAGSLDAAVNEAWEDVFENVWTRTGKFVAEEPDAGNASDDWVKTLSCAKELSELGRLRDLVLPARRAATLAEVDYDSISLEELVTVLESVHLDLSARGVPNWLNAKDLQIGLTFWTRPALLAATSDWSASLERLLADRATARAIRYAALRYNSARGALMDSADV